MAHRTLQDILADNGGGESVKLGDLVGDVITVTGFTSRPSTKYPGRTFVIIDFVDANGDELKARTGAQAIGQQLQEFEDGDLLPAEVLVASYDTDKGNPGLVFRNPDPDA
jgi:hypothetical protein